MKSELPAKEKDLSHIDAVALGDWQAFQNTAAILVLWMALALWISFTTPLLHARMAIKLALVLALSSMIAFKIAWTIPVEPLPLIDFILFNRRPNYGPLLFGKTLSFIIVGQLCLDKLIIFWLFGIIRTNTVNNHDFPFAVLLLSAMTEEILFRLLPITVLVWISNKVFPCGRSTLVPFWSSNVVQALLFGIAHVLEGDTLLPSAPWYTQLLAAPQTWSGLLLGYAFYHYGLEASIMVHITSNILWMLCP